MDFLISILNSIVTHTAERKLRVNNIRITGLFTGGQDGQEIPVGDGLELDAATVSFNEFIDVSNRFSECRVEMIFHSIVGPRVKRNRLPVELSGDLRPTITQCLLIRK